MSVVTVEEAKKLWCPMSRVAQAGSVDISTAYNRTITKELVPATVNVTSEDGGTEQQKAFVLSMNKSVSISALCVGNNCAMWRWHEAAYKVPRTRVMCNDPTAETEPERPSGLNQVFVFVPSDEDVDAHWAEPEESWTSRRRGYCGLAGRPEVL